MLLSRGSSQATRPRRCKSANGFKVNRSKRLTRARLTLWSFGRPGAVRAANLFRTSTAFTPGYKDQGLIVIGQDVSEPDESKVEPFIKKMGEKMTYRVALDDKSGGKSGKMDEAWMKAADQMGIPTAFIVDKTGTLAWIGHPATLNDKMIDAVLAGDFDVKKSRTDFLGAQKEQDQWRQAQQPISEFFAALRKKDWDAAERRDWPTQKRSCPSPTRTGCGCN